MQLFISLLANATVLYCATATVVLMILSAKQMKLCRQYLDEQAKALANRFIGLAVKLFFVAAVVVTLLGYFNQSLPLVAWVMLVPLGVPLVYPDLSIVRGTSRATPEGQPEGYDRIAADFAGAVGFVLAGPLTSDSQYRRAADFHEQRYQRDRLAQRCYNDAERLTVPQWRFMHELNDAVRAYKRRFPRIMLGQEWYDARKQQIAAVEAVVARAVELRDSKQLRNKGSEDLLFGITGQFLALPYLKTILEGLPDDEREGCETRQTMAEHQLEDMERKLGKMLVNARRALKLYRAEADGTLKYQTPVRLLIQWASYEKHDFRKCEIWLKQAVEQARNPDPDMYPPDLARALCCLADVYRAHLSEPVQAEALYREALPLYATYCGAESAQVAEVHASLAAALACQERFAEAEQQMRIAFALQRNHLPGSLSGVRIALAQVAWYCTKQGKMDEATKALIANLHLCAKNGQRLFGSRLEEVDALDRLIAHYVQIGELDKAVELTDRVLALQNERLKDEFKSPDELRAYAKAMQHAGRKTEAEEFERQAAARQQLYDEIADEPGFGEWNVLEHREMSRLLDDM